MEWTLDITAMEINEIAGVAVVSRFVLLVLVFGCISGVHILTVFDSHSFSFLFVPHCTGSK